MKGCLVVLAFVVLAAAGVLGLLRFLGGGERTEESLTRETTAQVTGSEFEYDARATQQRGYAVEFRYRVAGTWYAADSWVPEDQWTPASDAVTICTDPDDPASLVVPDRINARCGDRDVGRNSPQRAKVSSAP